jgi:hypothetical protein
LPERRTPIGSERWPPGSLLAMGIMEENGNCSALIDCLPAGRGGFSLPIGPYWGSRFF